MMTNYALIGKLEEKLNEIQAIVSELRGSRKIITFEGKHYQKVDREAREGEVVIFHEDSKRGYFKAGKPYKVLLNDEGTLSFEDDTSDWLDVYYNGRTTKNVDVYELITSPVFTTAEGQDLEVEYAEQVKQEVQHQTFQCSAARPPIEEVGQAFFEAANKVLNPKTPNQLRAEIIEKAKGFVEERKKERHSCIGAKGHPHEGEYLNFTDVYIVPAEKSLIDKKYNSVTKAEFIVNEEKRAIVALMRGVTTNRLISKGIAKCNPSDVFNVHIGKAIALGRALGLDVSEFEHAVQPSERVIGQIVKHGKVSLTLIPSNEVARLENGTARIHSMVADSYPIVNDTNAQYGDQA